MVLQANTVIRGKYRITRLIGDGGMGAVYEAEHLLLKVPVALKFLHADLAERPGLAERFLREARVSASIQSLHVTRVTDVDTTDAGAPFLVMELLRGESLQDLLDRQRRLPQATAIDYTLQILSGLEAAHALDVVHRDLKPDNVFIVQTPGGPVLKLIDFGIAKLRNSEEFKEALTRAGAMMGTPEYMAPEQLYSAENVDARADLFSVGVMLYEMLCGERPAAGEEPTEIVSQFVLGTIVPLQDRLHDVPEALAQVVTRALAAQREDRFDSAFSMRVALAPVATALSQAGAIAATPAPVPLQGTRASAIEEDPSTRRTSVADTLPPGTDPPVKTADD
ncbi:MAG TPA: serine/threonine-protein kinase, partial [Polyangiaceae bacterium]